MDQELLAFARTFAQDSYEEELALLKTLATIPAPSGHEDERAAFVAAWLRDAGCAQVEVDDAKNVLCYFGDSDAPELDVFSAHTDVVFDDLTPLPLREEGNLLYAPGVGDDTACLVGLMMVAKLTAHKPELVAQRSRGMLVVANSCEEGLGNLRGTRALYERYGERIKSHITFDTYLDHVVTSAVGSHRWRVTCTCQGGHSWKDFGRPNAIVELAALIADLARIELPGEARTTWNVGTIEGGSTVNSIPEHASLLYEYRSTSEACLQQMRDAFLAVVDAHRRDGVALDAESVGERPGNGDVDPAALEALERRLCNAMQAVTGTVDCHPSSTDANIPLSLGIPAACVGTVRGAQAHTRGEWVDATSLVDGLTLTAYLMLDTTA